ncbi:18714_t:CDS:2, partial [Acaulospora morrowiae]
MDNNRFFLIFLALFVLVCLTYHYLMSNFDGFSEDVFEIDSAGFDPIPPDRYIGRYYRNRYVSSSRKTKRDTEWENLYAEEYTSPYQ